MTSDLTKFLFEKDFDSAPPDETEEELLVAEEEVPELPPEPTFSEEELRIAREESFRAGKDDGLNEARKEREAEIASQLQAIGGQLTSLDEAARSTHEEARETALMIALSAVRKLLPGLERRHGLAEIENVVTECMQNLRDETRLVIRVADEQLDPLKARIEDWTTRNAFESKLVFLAEPGLAPSDVRVEWADGGAERDNTRLWQEIESTVARVLPEAVVEPLPDVTTSPQAVASAETEVHDTGFDAQRPREPVLAAGIAKVS